MIVSTDCSAVFSRWRPFVPPSKYMVFLMHGICVNFISIDSAVFARLTVVTRVTNTHTHTHTHTHRDTHTDTPHRDTQRLR